MSVSGNFKLIYRLLFFITGLAGKSHAQKETIDFQTWSDFTYTHKIKTVMNIGGDIGIRGIVSKNDWNQFYVRPKFQYYFNKTINVAGGIAFFYTSNDVILQTTELRIFEEVTLAWPSFEYVKFFNRIRLEQRFFTYDEEFHIGTELPNDFESRARYQLSFETLDIHLGSKNKPIYFLAGWEIFTALNDAAIETLINNQRFLGGIGQRLSPRFKYEIQYILQSSRIISDAGLKTTEHILRLRISLLSRSPSI